MNATTVSAHIRLWKTRNVHAPRKMCETINRLCETCQGKTLCTKPHDALEQISQKIRSLGVAHSQAYAVHSSAILLCGEDNSMPDLAYHHYSSSHAPWQTHQTSFNPHLAGNGPFWPLLVYRPSERLQASPCLR